MMPRPAPTDPFASLNEQQRAAVEHGSGAAPAEALLVIAGAGSGKTLTLASRVARLVLAGADPQRILLLTFSRRAAFEMERRVGRVLHRALGFAATQRTPQLHWSGTFTASRRGCCANTRRASAWPVTSRSTTAPIRKT